MKIQLSEIFNFNRRQHKKLLAVSRGKIEKNREVVFK